MKRRKWKLAAHTEQRTLLEAQRDRQLCRQHPIPELSHRIEVCLRKLCRVFPETRGRAARHILWQRRLRGPRRKGRWCAHTSPAQEQFQMIRGVCQGESSWTLRILASLCFHLRQIFAISPSRLGKHIWKQTGTRADACQCGVSMLRRGHLRRFYKVFECELCAAAAYCKPENSAISDSQSRSTRERGGNFFGQLIEIKVDSKRHPQEAILNLAGA